MNTETINKIAEIIKETYGDIILSDDKDTETHKILAVRLADLFERERNKFMPDSSIGLTKSEKKYYLENMFDRKEFLKACGVE